MRTVADGFVSVRPVCQTDNSSGFTSAKRSFTPPRQNAQQVKRRSLDPSAYCIPICHKAYSRGYPEWHTCSMRPGPSRLPHPIGSLEIKADRDVLPAAHSCWDRESLIDMFRGVQGLVLWFCWPATDVLFCRVPRDSHTSGLSQIEKVIFSGYAVIVMRRGQEMLFRPSFPTRCQNVPPLAWP